MRHLLPLLTLTLLACGNSSAPPSGDRVSPSAPSALAAASSTPEPPHAPAYDLAYDIHARTELARIDLGNGLAVHVEDGTFVIVAPFHTQVFDDSVALAQKAFAAYFNGRFAKHPEQAVTVYVFDHPKAYRAYCTERGHGGKCASEFGVYLRATREILVNQAPGLTTLTHELVHPLIEADFPKAPVWLNEGIAALFEAPAFPHPGEIHGTTNWRLPRLKRAFSSEDDRTFVALNNLFLLSEAAFSGGAGDLAYAMARYASQWLDSKNQLWPFYQAWRDHVADDPSGEKSFAAVVGRTPKEAAADWEKWVRAL